jgi:hypothetical protein
LPGYLVALLEVPPGRRYSELERLRRPPKSTTGTRRHVMAIVLGVGMKTLSNYTNPIAHTLLDPA